MSRSILLLHSRFITLAASICGMPRTSRRCFVVILSSMALAGCQPTNESKEAANARSLNSSSSSVDTAKQKSLGIQVATVQSKVIQDVYPAVGWLLAPPDADAVVRAPTAGFIQKDPKHPWLQLGQEVSEKTFLGTLNSFLTPLEVSQLIQAKEDADIQIEQSLITMKLTADQLKRVTSAKESVMGVRIDEIKEAYEKSKAAYQEAQQKLPFLAKEPYDDGVLLKPVSLSSPRSGRIRQIHANQSQFVVAGDPLWTISDWSTLWLRVPIFESDINKIKKEMSAAVHLQGGTEDLVAKPVNAPAETKAGTRTVDLLYSIQNPQWRLRTGQSVRVDLPLGKKVEATCIPFSSIIFDGFGQPFAYVRESNQEKFRRQRVELGKREGELVVVLKGIDRDDVVVSVGAEQLAAEESKAELSVEDDD